MNVLVVHDRREVGEKIQSIVRDLCPLSAVELVMDGSSAREKLATAFFDLLILDLTIPMVTGGHIGLEVAEGLLEELVASSTLLTPGSVLGITRDPDALNRVQNNIGPHLMAIVHEEEEGLWKAQLKDRIQYVQDSSASRARALLTKHDLDVLIVTALDKELAPLREFFELSDESEIPGVYEFVFSDRTGAVRKGACFAIGRAGQPSAASEAQGLLCQLRPRLALMIGFCGGVPEKTNLGDVLFAEMAVDWDYGKWKPNAAASRLYSRPEPITIRNSRSHRIARRLVEGGLRNGDALIGGMARRSNGVLSSPELRLVPFASGSAVVGDTNVLESINALGDNIAGVDMESFGFYFACQHPHAARPDFICIKAVADRCGPDKDDSLHEACCFASAYVANELVTMHWEF